jgi:hypothetical protein
MSVAITEETPRFSGSRRSAVVEGRAEMDLHLLKQVGREAVVPEKPGPQVPQARRVLPDRATMGATVPQEVAAVAEGPGRLASMAVETMEAMAGTERKTPFRASRPTTPVEVAVALRIM